LLDFLLKNHPPD